MTYDRLLNQTQAAEYLGLSRQYLARLAADGAVPVVRVGNSKRFSVRALDKWIENGGTRNA